MVKKEKVPMCPYCGSTKLDRIDWGFADWECQTCRNNFKSPYYPSEKPEREYDPTPRKYGFSDLIDDLFKYLLIIFFSLCVIGAAIFFIVRLYQIFILPFL